MDLLPLRRSSETLAPYVNSKAQVVTEVLLFQNPTPFVLDALRGTSLALGLKLTAS